MMIKCFKKSLHVSSDAVNGIAATVEVLDTVSFFEAPWSFTAELLKRVLLFNLN